ncbi:MAG: ELWxxDGT repeat protein, partial [Myxococcales bacterium]
MLLKDIRAGTTGSAPADFIAFKGAIYFAATETGSGEPGRELWRTDGTPAGTTLFKNIHPSGSGIDTGTMYPVLMGGHLYFAASEGGASGRELWRTDGTEAGTELVKDCLPGATSSLPQQLTVVLDRIFFVTNGGTTTGTGGGRELWVSDGTEAGTYEVKDINPGTTSSTPTNLTALGDKLVFTATDGVNGVELWVSDGTMAGTTMLKDVNPASTGTTNGSAYGEFTVVGNRLFFVANDGSGLKLWATDGTSAGTAVVKALRPDAPAGSIAQLTRVGSTLFFVADDGVHGAELWSSDGTDAGTRLVRDVRAGPAGSGIGELTAVGARVYFVANDGPHGAELWVSDGTAQGTRLVKDVLPGARGASPSALTAIDGLLFFGADDGVFGHEPWVSDGTEAGTRRAADLN